MQPLSQRQKALVRHSFRWIAGCHQTTAQHFFDRLFALDPEIERLFPTELAQQQRKFMNMLALLINALDEPRRFAELARSLGERHRAYGIQPHHYEAAQQALLWSLEQVMNDHFTAPVCAAWLAFYDAIAAEALASSDRS